MSSLKHLSTSVAKVNGRLFDRKYVTLGRLLNHWDLIVGQDLSKKSYPVKLLYRKTAYKKGPGSGSRLQVSRSKSGEVTLVISVSSAQSMLLHYRRELILEKINQVLGENAVSALKFTHHQDTGDFFCVNGHKSGDLNRESGKLEPDKEKLLTQRQRKYLSVAVADVEDEDLRLALRKYGSSIIVNATAAANQDLS